MLKARVITFTLLTAAICFTGCSQPKTDAAKDNNADTAKPAATASKNFTASDIAKLKWLEGTWRGTGDEQPPFFERYRLENETTLIVETLADDDLSKVQDTALFELKDGEFGHTEGGRRSAASEITDKMVQFIPVGGTGNSFRFERQTDGTWRAVLDSPGKDGGPAKQVIYKMEPWKAAGTK